MTEDEIKKFYANAGAERIAKILQFLEDVDLLLEAIRRDEETERNALPTMQQRSDKLGLAGED